MIDIAAAGGEAVEDTGELAAGENLTQALHAQLDVVPFALAYGEPFGVRASGMTPCAIRISRICFFLAARRAMFRRCDLA